MYDYYFINLEWWEVSYMDSIAHVCLAVAPVSCQNQRRLRQLFLYKVLIPKLETSG